MKLKISEIKPNTTNPRIIRDDKFLKLVESIKNFPEMLEAREIVLNKDHIILGGNMRFKAAIEAGLTEIPVKIVDWSEDKQAEFVIKDNTSNGEWDWDLLAAEWDLDLLTDWGVMNIGKSDKVDQVNNLEDTEWVGMPDFEIKDPTLRLVVSFDTEEDRHKFLEEFPVPIREQGAKTWSTWYPYKDFAKLKGIKHEFDQ